MSRVTPFSLRRSALLACGMALLNGASQAQTALQPIDGLYIGAGFGVNLVPSPNPDAPMTGLAGQRAGGQTVRIRELTGIAGNLAIGWGFGQGLRVELEGNGRGNAVNNGQVGKSQLSRTGGRGMGFSTSGFMVNALYDIQALRFDLGVPVTPYLGAGLGVASVSPTRFDLSTARGEALRLSGAQSLIAYQAIIGLAWELDRLTPGLALTTEYRFLGTPQPSFRASYTPPGGSAAAGSLRMTNTNSSLLIGLRYAFNAPARPAQAP